MPTIEIDYENDAEAWWLAARKTAIAAGTDPTFVRVFEAIDGGMLRGAFGGTAAATMTVSSQEVADFLAVARSLPAWDSGHPTGRFPVRIHF